MPSKNKLRIKELVRWPNSDDCRLVDRDRTTTAAVALVLPAEQSLLHDQGASLSLHI